MKTHVITELKKENPTLLLVFVTVALGMGQDARGITRIKHCKPPTTLKICLQEIGRARRIGYKYTALLYFKKNDIVLKQKRS